MADAITTAPPRFQEYAVEVGNIFRMSYDCTHNFYGRYVSDFHKISTHVSFDCHAIFSNVKVRQSKAIPVTGHRGL
jgi:hypothetical protein